MAQYFLALSLILCIPVGSLGTTTKPQQQSSGNMKDLCEVRKKYIYDLLVYLYCTQLLALFALTRHQYIHFIIWHFMFVLLYLLLDFCFKQIKVGGHCTKNMESGFALICELPC